MNQQSWADTLCDANAGKPNVPAKVKVHQTRLFAVACADLNGETNHIAICAMENSSLAILDYVFTYLGEAVYRTVKGLDTVKQMKEALRLKHKFAIAVTDVTKPNPTKH